METSIAAVEPAAAPVAPATDTAQAIVAPVATAEPEPAAQAPVAAPGEGLLDVRFTANCWAQVTDADGKVLISALKRAGESINMAVKLPLELRLGYASGAQVNFNGAAVDITPFRTGETARLKLGL